MSEGIEIVCVEENPHDNGANWYAGAYRIGELDVVSVKDMITKVIAKSNGQPIRRLTLIGHGGPGCQSVGCGTYYDWMGRRCLLVEPTTWLLVGEAEAELARLAGKFAPEAIVTLAGCNVAKGAYGRGLLRRISKVLGGVTVQGSEGEQIPILWVLKGTVIRCKGDTCWVAQTGREAAGLRK
jgi:hypothetical protein